MTTGNLVILHRNLLDAATLSASSSALPVVRLQDYRPGRVWRSTGCASEWVLVDHGTAQNMSHAAAVGYNLDAAGTIRVRVADLPGDFDEIQPAHTGPGATALSLPSYVTHSRTSAATYTNSAGVLTTAASGAARFDCDPTTGAAKGLLLEEARTNLMICSEQFDNPAWAKYYVTVTANAGAAPDGTATADLLTSTGDGIIDRTIVLAAGTTYTYSVWLKRGGSADVPLQLLAADYAGPGVLKRQSVTATADWQRVSITFTTSTAASHYLRIGAESTFTAGETLYAWGAQLEVGAFPTSYIPTTSATATRAADACSMLLSSIPGWDATQGTVIAEWITSAAANNFAVQISDGTYNNRIVLGFDASTVVGQAITGGSALMSPSSRPARVLGAVTRGAFAYSANSATVAGNGTLSADDTSGTVPSGLTRIDFGADHAGFNRLNGTLARVTLFNRRLSNAELQAVTAGGALPSGVILNVDFTRVNPTPVAVSDGTYDVLVAGEDGNGTQAKRWASLTVSGGAGTIQPLVTESRIVSYEAFPASGVGALTSAQKTRYAATGNTQHVGYDSGAVEAWSTVAGFGSDGFAGSLGGYPLLTSDNDYRPYRVFDFGGTVNGRYVRFDFANPTNAQGYIECGRLFTGLGVQPAHNFAYDWSWEWVDPSEVINTEASLFIVRRRKYRVLKLSLPFLTEEEAMTAFDDLKRIVGTSRDVIVVLFPNGSAPVQYRTTIYGIPNENGAISNPHYRLYSTSISVRELTK